MISSDESEGSIMKKNSWYIWLSIFGFMLLSCDTARRIRSRKTPREEKFSLWMRLCLNDLKLFVVYIILPIVIVGNILSFVLLDMLSLDSESLEVELVMVGFFIMLYFLGVLMTHKHVIWRNNNISHLLKSKESKIDMSSNGGEYSDTSEPLESDKDTELEMRIKKKKKE